MTGSDFGDDQFDMGNNIAPAGNFDNVADIEVLFFDGGGASSLRLEYESDTVKRRPIPASWLYVPAG